jgi:hypothetical protein
VRAELGDGDRSYPVTPQCATSGGLPHPAMAGVSSRHASYSAANAPAALAWMWWTGRVKLTVVP